VSSSQHVDVMVVHICSRIGLRCINVGTRSGGGGAGIMSGGSGNGIMGGGDVCCVRRCVHHKWGCCPEKDWYFTE